MYLLLPIGGADNTNHTDAMLKPTRVGALASHNTRMQQHRAGRAAAARSLLQLFLPPQSHTCNPDCPSGANQLAMAGQKTQQHT